MSLKNEPVPPEQALPRIAALLREGLPCRLVVTGNSMLPFLRHKRDAVFLVPAGDEIRAGDILLYLRGPRTPILHRVHGCRPDGVLIMCGDGQTGLEPITRERVLAKVSHVERNGRRIDCKTPVLRLLVVLWRGLYPVRSYLLAGMRKIGCIE